MQPNEVFLLILCILAALLAASVLAFFGALRYVYRRVFFSPKKRKDYTYELPEGHDSDGMHRLIEELASHPYEQVRIRSHDGLMLSARYYHVKDGAPVDVQCHGYRGSGLRDFCGGAKLSRALGHNILLIDERASGESEGSTITFGIKERYDVLAWANYVAERFGEDTEIYLYGISMGASTVIMSRTLPLPHSVVGIFADCPYDTPYNIIKKVVGGLGYPTEITMKLVCLGARLFGRFDLKEYDCIRAMREESRIPVYIVHGTADGFVPSRMSENIQSADPASARLLLIEGADHGMSFMTDPERYKAFVGEFLAQNKE